MTDLLSVVVDLVELDVGVLPGEALVDGCHDATRAAPGRPEVDDDGLFATNL